VRVTVVGAGVVGCAVAHALASRGAAVTIVDPRGAGRGATAASAGILAPHIESHTASFLRLALCSLASWDEFLHRVNADSTREVEYDRSGTLQVALDATQANALEAAARSLQAAGVECSLLDAQATVRLEPALTTHAVASLLLPAHGYVAPQPLVAALIEAAMHRGVSLQIARVTAVEEESPGPCLVTDTGRMTADAIVVAAGSWSSGVVKPHGPPAVTPIRGQLVQLWHRPRVASRVVWSEHCYIVPWRDGTVLVGATVEDVGFDENTTAQGIRGLIEAGSELIPALDGAQFQEARAGLRPKTSDELPAIGRSSTMPHVFYATGHYRNGVLLAPLTATLVADLVLDGRERPELADVRPDRFGL
jgi:glycine oxidase